MLHATTSALKYYLALGSCAVIALCTLYVARPAAQNNAFPDLKPPPPPIDRGEPAKDR